MVLADTAQAQPQTSTKDHVSRPDTEKWDHKELVPPKVPFGDIKSGALNIDVACPNPDDCYQDIGKNDANQTVYKLHGYPAEIEDSRMLLRAEYIEYNEDTKDLHAKGHVFYYNNDEKESVWCDELQFHTRRGEETATYTNLIVESQPRIVTKPGILKGTSPFHFEGERAEREGRRYILYDGWVTNCEVPHEENLGVNPQSWPWWQLRANRFDIIPHVRAKAYKSTFHVKGLPVFYFPWFYHPLQDEPRKSGFLLPEPGHSKLRGWTVGLGYFWAINRSYDVTYRLEAFSAGALTHHIDFRGKPKEGTDFDIIFFGAQDSGTPGTGTPEQKFNGETLVATANSDLGKGWNFHGSINFTSSLRFRQGWSQSFYEATGSEFHATGYFDKSWSGFTLDTIVSRLENFQTVEVPVLDPVTNQPTDYLTNAVVIHKLPEVEFNSRQRDLIPGFKLPLWLSFESSAGMLSRSEPFFDSADTHIIDRYQTNLFTARARLAPRLTTAFHFGPVHFVPSVGIDETFYGEDQTPYQDHYKPLGTNLVRSARDFRLDLILPTLERVYQKKSFLGDKVKHVIEPRATYRYVTGIGEDFNRYIRFDDTDLLSNTNEVEISLANRLFARHGDSVREVFSWEVLQKRYFDTTFGGALMPGQRNVFDATADLTAYAFLINGRSTSPVVSVVRASPIPGINIQWQADYDPRVHAIVDSTFSVDYHVKAYSFSLGNSEVHSSTILTPYANQYTFRAGYGDGNRRGWNIGTSGVYDYRERRLIYTTSQVTYNTDCCGLSVQYHFVTRVGLPPDGQFRVAFAVANIGSFGTLQKQDRLF